jgi:hypothetical protein
VRPGLAGEAVADPDHESPYGPAGAVDSGRGRPHVVAQLRGSLAGEGGTNLSVEHALGLLSM